MASKKSGIEKARRKTIQTLRDNQFIHNKKELSKKEEIRKIENEIKLCEYDLKNNFEGSVSIKNKLNNLKLKLEIFKK